MLNLAAFILSLAAGSPAGSAAAPTAPEPTVHNGRANQLEVAPPRLAGAGVEIDGRLDEPEWRQAAVLTGFSQYSPTDGIAAQDSTDVLVWYSPTAIHFGVRAYERHGAVHATLADRDRITGDDYVQILLGTFNDGRQALVFSVNPLGVQADGSLVETGQRTTGGFSANVVTREQADLSQDFVYQSKGRLTDYGYDVEIRIPFKSIRYQSVDVQRWGINIVRRVQHSGYEDSWVPAKRAGASFLAQSGVLTGLTDLRRGLVLDAIPTITQRTSGARAGDAGRNWQYDADRPEVGGNVRWGVTNDLTLNGTVRPDFSQVESDVSQVSYDPRNALQYPERRPFFLDGLEQFTTPSNLIYTRNIVQPLAAAKLTGKALGMNIALLSAVDDRTVEGLAAREDNPVFNVLRLQRDVGQQSRIGLAYTDRVEGSNYNRVANVDGRLVAGGIYSAQFQLAGSRTVRAGRTLDGPLWMLRLARAGRRFTANYSINGIDPDFVTQSGFISRRGVVNATLDHRYTWFRSPGALVESFSFGPRVNGTWQYRAFTRRADMQDKKLHFTGNAQLRGGWQVAASVLSESFGFDESLYAGYALERTLPGGVIDTVPFTGTPRIPNLDYVLSVNTPQFKRFSATGQFIWGRDENFYEWASADIYVAQFGADIRPTEKLRLNASYVHQQYDRRTDGSTVGVHRIPRLKVEYQVARPVFFRVVGQYDSDRQDALYDDSRTNFPILVRAGDGYVRAGREVARGFRADYLFSYQPTPGTVVFAGYGSTMTDLNPLDSRRSALERTNDGFFLKASYLLRL